MVTTLSKLLNLDKVLLLPFLFVIKFFKIIPSGYERDLGLFCKFVKIRVFVGISVFTRVFIYRTFVHF